MTCPFTRRGDNLPRQPSLIEPTGWNIEEDITESGYDALTLSHLNTAIQLLTAPSVGKPLIT